MTLEYADAQPTDTKPESTAGPTHEQIAQRAFARYQERAGADGGDLDDWLEAESELVHGLGSDDGGHAPWTAGN